MEIHHTNNLTTTNTADNIMGLPPRSFRVRPPTPTDTSEPATNRDQRQHDDDACDKSGQTRSWHVVGENMSPFNRCSFMDGVQALTVESTNHSVTSIQPCYWPLCSWSARTPLRVYLATLASHFWMWRMGSRMSSQLFFLLGHGSTHRTPHTTRSRHVHNTTLP